MIPDFVQQTKEILQKLKVQAEVTRSGWKDSVADKFYNKVVDVYDVKVEKYIEGANEIHGYGLNDLLVFFDEHEQALQELGDIPPPMTGIFAYNGYIVDRWNGQRDDWKDQESFIKDVHRSISDLEPRTYRTAVRPALTDIPNPSNLSFHDVKEIEAERDWSDRWDRNENELSGRCDKCGKPLFRCECSDRRNL